MNTIVRVASYIQRAATVEKQFAFAIESAFVAATSAVDQGVGSAIGQNDVGTFATEQVESCRVGVGDGDTIQLNGVFLVAHHCQRTIFGGTTYHVAHFLRGAVIGSDVTSIHRHLYTIFRLGCRVRQIDGYFCRKLIVLQQILLFREILGGSLFRLCRHGIETDVECSQFTCDSRTATSVCRIAAIIPTVATAVILKFCQRIFLRAACVNCDGCCKHRENHHLFHIFLFF